MRNLIPRGPPFISQTETSPWPSTIHDKRRLNPRTYTQFIPPPWYKGSGGRGGGVMEPLPAVFDMLQYFQTILPSVESLCSSQQDKVHFIGGGAARGL